MTPLFLAVNFYNPPIFTSRVSGRGNIIGPVCVSMRPFVCLSVCPWALSQLNRLLSALTYDHNFGVSCTLVLYLPFICQMSCEQPAKSSMPISTSSQITVDCKSVH